MKSPDLSKYSDHLEFSNGVWVALNERKVSYPAGGHDKCFQLEDKSFWFIHRNQCITTVVRSFPPSGPIFDVGGGNGFVSRELERNGFTVCLVEPGKEAIANARQRGLAHLIRSTFEDARFRGNSIPAVGIFDVLEHVEEDSVFLLGIHDVLSPGGRLYLTVPAFNLLWSVEDDYAAHFRRYTLNQIAGKLHAADFKIEYATYIFSFLLFPILLFRSIPSRIFKKKEHSEEKTRKQFVQNRGVINKYLNRSCKKELKNIWRKKKIRYGSSCLVVARKTGGKHESSLQ